MALPASGPISMGDINVELGRTRTASISLDAAENGTYATINQNSSSKPSSTNPATISEWRGYNHTAVSSGGGGGTVSTGYLNNMTGHTISATYMAIKANGTSVAYISVPALAHGALYQFNTSYTSLFSNGTFVVDLYTPVVGLTTSNYFYMTSGSNSTNGYFSNTGSSLRATVTSSGPQYSITITIK